MILGSVERIKDHQILSRSDGIPWTTELRGYEFVEAAMNIEHPRHKRLGIPARGSGQ